MFIDGVESKYAFKFKSGSIEDARKEIDKLVKEIAISNFEETIKKHNRTKELTKNDTKKEIFAKYNTKKGRPAFIVYRKIFYGKEVFNSEGNVYVPLTSRDDLNSTKEKIDDVVKKDGLIYVQGYEVK